MKNKLFTGLFATVFASACFGQHNQMSDQPQPEGWFYSKLDSAYIEYEAFDTLCAPDKKFKILVRAVGLPDLVTKCQYWLIGPDQKDTISLMAVLRRDLPRPNFYWTSDGYLIYEESKQYGQDSKIHMRNLHTNKVDFSTPGAIPIGAKWSHHFYDRNNEILIFFKIGTKETTYKPTLMKLDIKNKTVGMLMAFETKLEYE